MLCHMRMAVNPDRRFPPRDSSVQATNKQCLKADTFHLACYGSYSDYFPLASLKPLNSLAASTARYMIVVNEPCPRTPPTDGLSSQLLDLVRRQPSEHL